MKLGRAFLGLLTTLVVLSACATTAAAVDPFTALVTKNSPDYEDTAIVLQDGSGILFQTSAQLDPADTDAQRDVYKYAADGTITFLTPDLADSTSLDLVGATDDGSTFYVETTNSAISAGQDTDTSDTDVYAISGGAATFISQSDDEVEPNESVEVDFAGVTPDGSAVYFETTARMSTADNDGGALDVYERRPSTGTTTLISTSEFDPQANQEASFCGVSDNGAVVAFDTNAEMTAADDDGLQTDTYRRSGGTTTLASTGPDDQDGANDATCKGVSGDGTAIAFESTAVLFAGDDSSDSRDVFTFNGLETRWVSTSSHNQATVQNAEFGAMSWDGDTVFYNTTNAMLASDTDSSDMDGYSLSPSGVTTLLTAGETSIDTSGAFIRAVSKDLSTLLIKTNDQYVPADTDPDESDLYARFDGAPPVLISSSPLDLHGSIQHTQLFDNDFNRKWTLSADGRTIAWTTFALLTSDDTDVQSDVYAYFRPAPPAGGTPPAAVPTDASPVITSAKFNRSKFSVNKRGKALKAFAAKAGATLSFSLSESAKVVGTVYTCKKLVKTRCKGRRKIRSTFAVSGKAGKNSVAFSGKLSRSALKPGGHQLELVATDSAGQKSTKRTLVFTIVKR